ncbi:MAG: c-type cytochrome domain-containing protein, partial [Pirellulales bacterium]
MNRRTFHKSAGPGSGLIGLKSVLAQDLVRWSAWFLLPMLVAVFGLRLLAAEKPEQIEFFERRIRPVLVQDCYQCHNSKGEAEGGLVLDHRHGLLRGGDRGPAIVAGKPDQSLLIQAIRHDVEDMEMPNAAPKLDAAIIRDFEQWVRMGAADPRDQPPTDAELDADTDWTAVMERRKSWWSFQPIDDPAPPAINAINHPIDRFIRHRLRETRLTPAE